MRKERRFLTALALEALIEKLATKTKCLLTFGRNNHTPTNFTTYAEVLNILLEVSRIDPYSEKGDSVEEFPIAKQLVYVMLRKNEAECPETVHSLALPLEAKLYTSIIEHEVREAKEEMKPNSRHHFKVDKKRKLNGGTGPFEASASLNPSNQAEKSNIFNLERGHFFGEDLTYKDFQRSGVMAIEKEFTHYDNENFLLNHSFREEVNKFLTEQDKKTNDNLGVFRIDKPTTQNPHSFAMGTLQHLQADINHPFGINLEIPPLPRFDPQNPSTNVGIGVFTLGGASAPPAFGSSMRSNPAVGLTFTLPQNDTNADFTRVSNILEQEKLRSSKRSIHTRFQDSIFAQDTMLKEILKEKREDEFDVTNLWEDYGLSKNDNRFKDLNVAPCGLVTKEICREFKAKAEKSLANLLDEKYQEIEDGVLIESLSMALIGLSGELFELNEQEMTFYINKLLICLVNFTHQTLFKSLEPFRKSATEFYRIQRLIDHFKHRGKGTLVTNIFYELLQDYITHYSSSIFRIKSESQGYLDFEVRCRKILHELEIVYNITFCKAIREELGLNELEKCIPKSGYLINFNYNLLNSIELSSVHVDLVQHIFKKTVKPLLDYIAALVFRGLLVDEYNEFFVKYHIEKEAFILEESGDEVHFPLFLKNVLPAVVECANNMLLFKNYDKPYYDVLKEEAFEIDVKFENGEVREYELQATERFELKYKFLDRLSADMRIAEEQKQYEQIQKKLRYLKKIKEIMEKEAEEYQKAIDEQKEQKENLKRALEEQIYHRQILNKYTKEIEREAEKSFMLEQELKLRQQYEKEKRELLRELREIQGGAAIFGEEERDIYGLTHMELENRNDQDRDSQENLIPIDKEDIEGEPSTPPRSIRKSMMESEFQQPSEKVLPRKSLRKTRRKWGDGAAEQPFADAEENIHEDNTITGMKSPPRIRGYKTPAKEDNTTNKSPQRNKWAQRRMEIKDREDDLLNVVRERMPIDILVQICVSNVIEEQNRLTNKAIVQILLEKHKLKGVLEYLKRYLFAGSGDKVDAYAETLFKESSDTNWQAVVNSNSFWEDKIPEGFKFYFELKTKATAFIPQSVENLDLTFYMDLRCEMSPILKRMFNLDNLKSYLRIFTFIVKLRHLSLIISRKWKIIGKDLVDIREYRRFAKHAQILRHKLQTFIDNYQEYIYTSIIEGSWKKLCNKLVKAKSLEDLVRAHDNYLESILKRCFIDTYIRNVSESISRIVSIIVRFNEMINNLAYSGGANGRVNYIKLAEYSDELRTQGEKFDEYQNFMSIVFEKVVERDQQNQFISQNLF